MTCSILVGGAWGDEGKGKCITYLCGNDKPDIIARAGVGPNAGHSVEFNGEKYGLRLIPSGFVHTDAKLMIGAGVLVDKDVLFKEFEDLKKYNVKERTFVDPRCAIITKDHRERDKKSEHLAKKIGSTGSGCGPANSIALYFLGKKAQKRKDEQDAQLAATAQTVTMLIIDKKRMRLNQSGLPQAVIDQTPKLMRRSKLPIVKAKVGPKVMTLIADDACFDMIPVKKEVKATVSGIEIFFRVLLLRMP